MPLSFDSPRFSLSSCDFKQVKKEIATTGHVVLDDVWNVKYLRALHDLTRAYWVKNDELHARHEPLSDLHGYLGGETAFEFLFAPDQSGRSHAWNAWRELTVEFERTGLPALCRHLFDGHAFLLAKTFCSIRRIDPRFKMRFTGLHTDGQLRHWAERGIHSNDKFTIWTPLQNCCDNDTPRLLLLHREDDFLDVFKTDDRFRFQNEEYAFIQNNPAIIHDQDWLESQGADRVEAQFEQLYHHKRCYAPAVPLGSIVLFDGRIWHGSYRTGSMKTPRFSIDVRVLGRFDSSQTSEPFEGIAYNSESVAFPTEQKPLSRPLVAQMLDPLRQLARALGLRRIFPKTPMTH